MTLGQLEELIRVKIRERSAGDVDQFRRAFMIFGSPTVPLPPLLPLCVNAGLYVRSCHPLIQACFYL